MLLECIEQEDKVILKISNYDTKFIPIFKSCFYQEGDGFYFKTFSSPVKHLDKIRRNFIKHGPEMFSQSGYFQPVPWEDALLSFIHRVEGKGITWWLTGSCASCIRGIPLRPHDIDIMLDSSDFPKLESLFAEEIIEPFQDTDGWVTKEFGVLFLKSRIDIATDPSPVLDNPQPVDCGPYAREHLETVEWRGHSIKVPPLELQLYVNKLRNRHDRVELIRQAMEQ